MNLYGLWVCIGVSNALVGQCVMLVAILQMFSKLCQLTASSPNTPAALFTCWYIDLAQECVNIINQLHINRFVWCRGGRVCKVVQCVCNDTYMAKHFQ